MAEEQRTKIIHDAEPFLFQGGRVGVLLVHGFTGTPKEMRWLGEYLAKKGHTVLGIRLAGHATQPQDLLRTTWIDWLLSVEEGFKLLQTCTDQIYIIGLSLGGILTLVSATILPAQGVVAMSTLYSMPPDPRLPFIRWLYRIQPRLPKPPSDLQDLQASQDHIEYPYYPTKAFIQLVELLGRLHESLKKIQIPVLLIHSKADQSVPSENSSKIYAEIGSKNKQIILLEKSGHVITRDIERQRVFEAIEEFIIATCNSYNEY